MNFRCYFGVYAPSIVQRTVYRTAGYACQLRDLLCGYSHVFSSLFYDRKHRSFHCAVFPHHILFSLFTV